MSPDDLDERGVYRVRLPKDEQPEPRLAIGPRLFDGKQLNFFDTLRSRTLDGKVIQDARAPDDAVCFQVNEGERLWLEPMTLARWNEIKDRIDGRPDFASEAELKAFYLEMIGE